MTLLATEVQQLHSKITGYDYVISVALPAVYQRDQQARFPAFYLLDAHMAFGTVTEGSRLLNYSEQIPPVLIVGIAVGARTPVEQARFRNFAFTPRLNGKDNDAGTGNGGEAPNGGAPLFLRSLKEEIIPLIESTYRTSAYRALGGYSISALFTSYALLASPETFQRYVLVSPSLWWGNGALIQQVSALSKTGPQKGRQVFIAYGSEEEKDIVDGSQAFARALRASTDAVVELRVGQNEDHFLGLGVNYVRGLFYLYGNGRGPGRTGVGRPQ
jgi:predicted alpha/beta superfamily hydrolase